MKKVKNYIQNLGKSVKYASADIVKNLSPSTAELIETNSDLFKEMSSMVRNRRVMIDRTSTLMKRSKVYEAGTELKKSIFEDIMSGNLYNKERKDKFEAKALGMDDMEMDIDMDFGDDDFDSFNDEDLSNGDKFVSKSVEESARASAEMISTTLARTGEYIVESQKSMNEYNMMMHMQTFNNMNSIMTSINENLTHVVTFNNEAHKIHIENSKKYYEETTNILRENNALLKEFVEMERNKYQDALNQQKGGSKRFTYDDVVGSSGIPDFREYLNAVSKNITNKFSSLNTMNNAFGEDSNILLTFASSPLEFIPKWFVSNLITNNLKSSVKKLDKSLSSFFSALITRFNTMAKEENLIAKNIGEIFGLKNQLDTTIDSSKYKKGPVPWDGKSRQALIEVIPTHLSKIVSLLSGKPEKIYNYERGTFIESKDIKKEYDARINSSVSNSTSEARDYMENLLQSTFAFKDARTNKKLKEDMDKFFKYFFMTGNLFDYNRKSYDDYEDIGISSEDNYNIIKSLFKNMPRNMQLKFYKDIMGGRTDLTGTMKNLESQGDSIFRYISNNAGLGELFDDSGKFKHDKVNGILSGSNLLNTKDSLGNNIFFYLNKITSTLLDGIKVFVLNNGGGAYGISGSGGPSPNRYANRMMNRNTSAINSILNRDTNLNNISNSSYSQQINQIRDDERFERNEQRRAERGNLRYLEDVIDNDSVTVDGVIRTQQEINQQRERMNNQNRQGVFGEFVNDLLGSNTLIDKFKVMNNRIKKVFESPFNLVSGMIDRIDLRLYEVIYGKENREYRGMRVRGFLDMIMVDLQNTFDRFNTWLDERILTPISERMNGLGSRLVDGLLMGMGINMTSGELGAKIKRFFVGEKDEDGEYIHRGLISDFKDQVSSDLHGIKNYIFGRNSTFRKIYRLLQNYAYDSSKHNDEDRFELIYNIKYEMTKFHSNNEEEKKVARSINNALGRMTRNNMQEILTNIVNILKENGYDQKDGSLLGILKESFKEAKEYTIGQRNIMDQLNKMLNVDDYSRFNFTNNDPMELNVNKFIGLVNTLKKYLSSSDSKKFVLINTILNNIKDIQAENPKEVELKNTLLKIYNDNFSKWGVDNLDDIALKLLKSLKGKLPINISSFLIKYDILFGNSQKDNINSGFINSINNLNSMNNTFNQENDTQNPLDVMKSIMNNNLGIDGYHAEGLKRVPFDNYLAVLHKGERVLTEEEAEKVEDYENIVKFPNNKGFKSGTEQDVNYAVINKISNMMKRFDPKSDTDVMTKDTIINLLNKFNGNNINEILDKIKDETEFNIGNRKKSIEGSLLYKVTEEFKNMYKATQRVLFGTDNIEKDENIINEKFNDAVKDMTYNIREYLPKMGSGALIGSGIGILPGVIGGPLMWAGIGAGYALTKNSNKVQEYLFGEVKDGERQGGLVKKKYIDAFSKYAPSLKKSGVLGAAIGLMPFTPFGVVGGLTAGVLFGFAKKNETVQNALFGEHGIIGPELKNKILSKLPRTVTGAITGGIASTLIGPFGIVGGSMIGAGMGYLSHTKKFQEALFGKDDGTGKIKGGVLSFIRETFLDAKYFIKENMLKPIKSIMTPLRKEVGLIAKKVKDNIINVIDRFFDRTIGSPVKEFMKKWIFKPLGKMFKGAGKLLFNGITEGITLPFKYIGYMDRELRLKHIKSGNATYMNEEEQRQLLESSPKLKFERYLDSLFGSKAKRRKNSQQEETSNQQSFEPETQTNEQLQTTNTTLSELLGHVVEIVTHLKQKSDERKERVKDYNESRNNVEQAANEAASQVRDNIVLPTTEGVIEYERDFKGDHVPKDNNVYRQHVAKQDRQSTIMEQIRDLSRENVDENREQTKKMNLLGKLKSGFSGFFSLLDNIRPILLLSLPFLPKIFSVLTNLFGGKDSESLGNKATDALAGIVSSGIKSIGTGIGSIAKNVLGSVTDNIDGFKRKAVNYLVYSKSMLAKGARGLINKGANLVKKGLETSGAIRKLQQFFEKVLLSPKVVGFFKRIFGSKGEDICLKLSYKLGPNVLKNSSDDVARVATKQLGNIFLPITITLFVSDLVSGMADAKNILQMEGDLPVKFRVIAGLVKAINNRLTFGLVPQKFIMEVLIDLIGTEEEQDYIDEAQQKLIDSWKKYNLQNPENTVDFDEYNDMRNKKFWSLPKFNNNYKVNTTYNPRSTWNKNNTTTYNYGMPYGDPRTNKSGNTHYNPRARYGRGRTRGIGQNTNNDTNFPFYSQNNSNWSKTSYTGINDTNKQTIGDAGCGPTAAAMVVSGLTGNNVTPKDAANYALQNNFKEPDGGTYPQFFTSFYNKYGISSNITDMNQNKEESVNSVINNLKNNVPVVLMGKSTNSNSPFGKNPHYVLATGIDKDKNIIINDPENKTGGTKYNLMNTLKDSSLSISSTTNNNNAQTYGEEAFVNYDINNDKSDYSSYGPIVELIRTTEYIFNKMLGIRSGTNSTNNMTPLESSLYNYSSTYNPFQTKTFDINSFRGKRLSIKQLDFIKKILPGAIAAYHQYKILPSITIAQAILESGWGNSSIGNNMFGIKVSKGWTGKTKTVMTTEYYNGTPKKVRDTFKDYDSIDESILDHSKLVGTASRYSKVRSATNYKQAAYALQNAGYATDPNYAKKLINTIEYYGLDEIDKQVARNNISNVINNITLRGNSVKGNVTGKTNMHSWMLDRLNSLSHAHNNKEIYVESGYRSKQDQIRIWNDHKRNHPEMSDKERRNWVANPYGIGSTHMMGVAADIKSQWVKNLSKEELAKYGLWRPLSNENWHFEAVETGYPDPAKRRRLYSSLPSKFGTPDNPRYKPSISYGMGKNNISGKRPMVPKIDTNDMYGKGSLTASRTLSIPNISTNNTSNSIENSDSNLSNKILAVLIELLTKIVNNTNNLSEVVALLSKGLNINIPEDKLKKNNIKTGLTNIISNTSDVSNENLLNLINTLGDIATE